MAKDQNVSLNAEFLPTDRNRMMYMTYKFAGFKERGKRGEVILLEHDLSKIQPFPPYVVVFV